MGKSILQVHPLEEIGNTLKQLLPKGVQLSGIQYVSPATLKANPISEQYFKKENEDYFAKLTEDVQRRGILVPLIAKKDGTLLAGHNRLKIAIEISLEIVPVQYVLDELMKEQEKEFIIKDNVLRRQLIYEERLNLYRAVYPNFDQQALEETRGGDRSEDSKRASGSFDTKGVTAEELSKRTGIASRTTKRDLAKFRKESKGVKAKKFSEIDKTRIDIISELSEVRSAIRRKDPKLIQKAIEQNKKINILLKKLYQQIKSNTK
jgi:ParB-like chromosome segregation protein Spo0J